MWRGLVRPVFRLVVLCILAVSAAPQTPPEIISQIRTELDHVRAEIPQHLETRGASPELSTIKHQLRDWVESQLGQLPSDANGEDGDEVALAIRLNDQLRAGHLFREGSEAGEDDDWNGGGFLGRIRLQYTQRQAYLLLQTAIEVNCAFDESAYLYSWRDGGWHRIWETEQNTYTKNGYTVQTIHAVLVSPPFTDPWPFVMTLGTAPWCSSNWRGVFVRIWKVNPAGPKLLLDKSEPAYLGGHDIPIEGSIGREDALVEYTSASLDPDVFREVVLHYMLRPDKVERIGPIALSPRDFVDAWLNQPWEESRRWTERAGLEALKAVHARGTEGHDQFQPTRRCRSADLWQVGLGAQDGKAAPIYFLVRWRPPYEFTMVRSMALPSPHCKREDAMADEPRTLFPVQDWRE